MDFIESQSEFNNYYKENIKILQNLLKEKESQKLLDEVLTIQFLIEILREQIVNENTYNSHR
jgi:hypothetical protein